MLSALDRELPEASWSAPAGGYFLWLELPAGLRCREALAAAERAGVTFVSGEDFFLDPEEGAHAARLAFSFASPEQIDEGVALLAGACAGAAA
jgi:DNA-binding transcriptional MocR family regulator